MSHLLLQPWNLMGKASFPLEKERREGLACENTVLKLWSELVKVAPIDNMPRLSLESC